jgi:hypothetical protein
MKKLKKYWMCLIPTFFTFEFYAAVAAYFEMKRPPKQRWSEWADTYFEAFISSNLFIGAVFGICLIGILPIVLAAIFTIKCFEAKDK